MREHELLAGRAREVEAGAFEDHTPSPCVSICRMNPVSELCEGCFRNLDEIAAWSRMGEDDKRRTWRDIAQRLQQKRQAA